MPQKRFMGKARGEKSSVRLSGVGVQREEI